MIRRTTPTSLRLPQLALVFVALTVCGCGYNQVGDEPVASSATTRPGGYQWRSLYREDIKTVAVPIFVNKDFERGVEFNLTKAVINQLELHTPYKVVPRERADTILEGEITSVTRDLVNRDRNTGLPQETLYVITMDLVWKDLRTGQILVERRGYEQTAPYYPTLGEDRYHGNQLAVEKLAVAIVQELQANW